jgi:hypothetical protein
LGSARIFSRSRAAEDVPDISGLSSAGINGHKTTRPSSIHRSCEQNFWSPA